MNYRQRIYSTYVTNKMVNLRDYSEAGYRIAAKVIASRIRGWLPDDKSAPILDLGCGHGNVLYLLAHAGYTNVTGVDLSLEQLNLARQWCQQIVQGEALDFLQHQTRQFQVIIAFDLIEHFTKDEFMLLIEALFNALLPGGRLIIQTPNADSPWVSAERYSDFTHEIAFNALSLEHVLKLVGFSEFQGRECAPHIHSLKSAIRFCLWKFIHMGLHVWELVETGGTESGIYTRVFISSVVKPS
jgi:2-polyprenyl-3-methyl-5-hydroxy-6-metoxy-1,4-benzoquinol methylase